MAQKHLHPDPGLDPGHRGPVNPRGPRPGVRRYMLPRVHQKRRIIDEVVQVTETAGGILSRPTMQFGLHPPYRVIRRTFARPPRGAGIHRRVFGHCLPSSLNTLPFFPMYAALPRSEYYNGSAPPAPSAGVAPIRTPLPLAEGRVRTSHGWIPRSLLSG